MKYLALIILSLALTVRGTFAATYTTLEYENRREANTLATVRGEIAAASNVAVRVAADVPNLRRRDDFTVGPRMTAWTVSYRGGEEILATSVDNAYTNFYGVASDGVTEARVLISQQGSKNYRYNVEYAMRPPSAPIAFITFSSYPLTELSNRGVVATELWSGAYDATNSIAFITDVSAAAIAATNYTDSVATTLRGEIAAINVAPTVSNIVSQAYIREKLGVYLYIGEDGGVYVHTED